MFSFFEQLSKFKKDVLFSYFTQGIALSTSFVNFFLITQFAGLEVYGQYAVLAASLGFISAIVMVRSGESVVKFYKTEVIKGDLSKAKAYLLYGFLFDLVTAVFLLLLVYVTTGVIAEYLLKSKELESSVLIFSLINISVLLRGTCLGYFQSKERFNLINGLKVFESVLISVALFVALSQFGSSLHNVINAYIVASTSSLLLFYLYYFVYASRESTTRAQIDKSSFQKYFRFNFVTFFSSGLKAGNKSYDGIVLAYFTSPVVVGVYSILKKFFMPAEMLVQPFRNILYPKVVKFWELDEKQKLRILIRTISVRLVFVVMAYGGVLYLCSGLIFNLFNIEGQIDGYIILLFSVTYTLMTSMWWTRIFSNTVNPVYSLVAGAFSTVYQLLVSTLAVYYFGLVGLICSMLSVNVLLFVYWRRLLKNVLA